MTYEENNLFAYAIDLENENWTYAPKGLDYGMTVEEVIKAEQIANYTWEAEDDIINTGESSGRVVEDKIKDGKDSEGETFRKFKVPNHKGSLGIDISYGGEVTVSLAVSRYGNRITVEKVQ